MVTVTDILDGLPRTPEMDESSEEDTSQAEQSNVPPDEPTLFQVIDLEELLASSGTGPYYGEDTCSGGFPPCRD